MNFGVNELARCAVEEVKKETAKELLENMKAILKEMNTEVRMISDAVYRGANFNQEAPDEPKVTPPMVDIMQEQRNMAQDILDELIKIRQALW